MATVGTIPMHLQPQAMASAFKTPLPRPIGLRKPIPNSYWATPNLLACEYPWAPSTPHPKLDALLAAGVRTFIDLTECGELIGYQQLLPVRAQFCGLPAADVHAIEYFRFPIPDRKCPESMDFLASILDVLNACERRGRVAAVHCRGGIGRTGTVVGCWLVESARAHDGEEALRMIAAEWKTVEKCGRFPCSPETGPQFEFVRNFKKLPTRRADGSIEAHW
ncbi:protein-tyrosine phosphatase-like protein [Phellopilus nigrolimitatus]|nr:protein-tyrosine phosphatase-like protein [Phellopilus nigrolimitatus]